MLHLFQEAISLFDEVKAKIEGAASAATSAVASGISWTDDEIKAAEVAVFTKVETTSMTLSQAFAEGAKWAAARVQTATAPAATVAATTAPAETGSTSSAPAVETAPVADEAAPVADATPEAAQAAEAVATPATDASTPAA